jgi:hypothetical protein
MAEVVLSPRHIEVLNEIFKRGVGLGLGECSLFLLPDGEKVAAAG